MRIHIGQYYFNPVRVLQLADKPEVALVLCKVSDCKGDIEIDRPERDLNGLGVIAFENRDIPPDLEFAKQQGLNHIKLIHKRKGEAVVVLYKDAINHRGNSEGSVWFGEATRRAKEF